MKPDYQTVIRELELLERLADYDPVVIGTPPLGIETGGSDIDIACSASNIDGFGQVAKESFGSCGDFNQRTLKNQEHPALLTSFSHAGWVIEIFCQELPIGKQWGVRHFQVEQRLLLLAPELRPAVQRLKESGLKTEPAFSRILGLTGDPYHALLDLETKSDAVLRRIIQRRAKYLSAT